MRKAVFLAIGFIVFFGASLAQATVRVSIDLSQQRMHVQSREGSFDWPISSARSGFSTPGGSYAPTHLELMHYSRKYHMSPMPHAIFFRGGYAIHGTSATGSLGRPASHGCVRLSPGNAAALYAMVQDEGARIAISGSPPIGRAVYASSERRGLYRGEDEDVLFQRAMRSRRTLAEGTGDDQAYARRRPLRRATIGYTYGYGPVPGYAYAATPPQFQGYRAGYAYAPSYSYAPQAPILPFYGE